MRGRVLIAMTVIVVALVAVAGVAIAAARRGEPPPTIQLGTTTPTGAPVSPAEATADTPAEASPGTPAQATPDAAAPSPAPSVEGIGQARAEAAAVAVVGGGTAVFSHLDRDDGFTVWDVLVEGPDGAYDVEVDAASGEILGFDHDDDGRAPAAGDPTVDRTAAEAAAVAAVGGGEAVASHLDRDDGVPEWEIAVVADAALYEVTVDAVDGSVRELDRDD